MATNLSQHLEDLVLASGLASADSVARARAVSQKTGEALDGVLTRLGLVSEAALADAIGRSTGVPIATSDAYPGDDVTDGRISSRFLRDSRAVVLAAAEAGIDVALTNPTNAYTLNALSFATGLPVRPLVGRAGDIEAALDRIFGPSSQEHLAAGGEEADDDLERLKDHASDAPVVRAVNVLITRAADARASDIHVEPTEEGLRVRFRIDGVLVDQPSLPAPFKTALLSRIKVMAGLNIAERRLPQDGRLRLAVRGQDLDLRVATSPAIHGEAAVLRLLDRSNLTLDFDSLGFDAGERARLERALAQPHGVVLATGPTGSGKTTTLYAALASMNSAERKILTIEDPIEYRLAGVNQVQVNPQIGLDFAAGLRSFLRQDPDVIMVGEIRDLETAQIAVQAALTGHILLSTIHTNTAASAVTRLIDMGVEPFLITTTLNAVLAQRLVRRLCPHCAVAYEPDRALLRSLHGQACETGPSLFYRPAGCQACGQAGYRGRLALVELLVMNEEIAGLVLARAEARQVERAAIRGGMRPMVEDGLLKAAAGHTTLEEVFRVTRED
ncbi:MAG TPA: GspE/PulE family protein [Caulobacteraceae bacterium]|nr:GspE/PulE family protein [Caulobacteraceae bacterium]